MIYNKVFRENSKNKWWSCHGSRHRINVDLAREADSEWKYSNLIQPYEQTSNKNIQSWSSPMSRHRKKKKSHPRGDLPTKADIDLNPVASTKQTIMNHQFWHPISGIWVVREDLKSTVNNNMIQWTKYYILYCNPIFLI